MDYLYLGLTDIEKIEPLCNEFDCIEAACNWLSCNSVICVCLGPVLCPSLF